MQRKKRSRSSGKSIQNSAPGPLQGWRDGIPSSVRTHLKFSVSSNVASSGTLATPLVSINNLFDPGVSLSAAQPVYFDQLALMYNRYRVYASKIKVIAAFQANTSGVGTTQMSSRLVVAPINGALTPTTIEDAIAQSSAKWDEATSTKPAKVVQSVTCAALTGSRNITGSDRFQATVGAAPTEVLNWAVSYLNNVTQSAIDFHIEIELTYDVEFFDRINLDRSTLAFQLLHKAVAERISMSRAAERVLALKALGQGDEKQDVKDYELVPVPLERQGMVPMDKSAVPAGLDPRFTTPRSSAPGNSFLRKA